MSKQNNLTDFLTDVADAIREKKGTQALINPQDFSSEIASISGGSNPLQDMLDISSDTDASNLFRSSDYPNYNVFKYLTCEVLAKLDFSKKHYTTTNNMFYNLPNLTTIPPQLDLSNVTNAEGMFYQCTGLKKLNQVDFGQAYRTSSLCTWCANLESADFLKLMEIQQNAFNYCTKLTVFVLRNADITPLQATSAFQHTPIERGTGYIYVPDDLVDSYKSATNWATYASQIKGISELPQGE